MSNNITLGSDLSHEFCLYVKNTSATELRAMFDGTEFLEYAQVYGLMLAMAASLSVAVLLRMRWRVYNALALAAEILTFAGLLGTSLDEDSGAVGAVVSAGVLHGGTEGRAMPPPAASSLQAQRLHQLETRSGPGGHKLDRHRDWRRRRELWREGGAGYGAPSLPPLPSAGLVVHPISEATPSHGGRRTRRSSLPTSARGKDGGCCNNARRVWWLSRLVLLVISSPIVVTVIWGSVVANNLCPSLVGLGIATLGPASLLLVYGFRLWSSRQWRLASTHPGMSAVQWSFTAAFVCVILFALCAVITYKSFAATSWLFLGLDMFPMVAISYWLGSWHHPRASLVSVTLEPNGDMPWESGDRRADEAARRADAARKAKLVYGGVALPLLVAYGVTSTFVGDEFTDGVVLGWVNFFAIVVLDLVTLLLYVFLQCALANRWYS